MAGRGMAPSPTCGGLCGAGDGRAKDGTDAWMLGSLVALVGGLPTRPLCAATSPPCPPKDGLGAPGKFARFCGNVFWQAPRTPTWVQAEFISLSVVRPCPQTSQGQALCRLCAGSSELNRGRLNQAHLVNNFTAVASLASFATSYRLAETIGGDARSKLVFGLVRCEACLHVEKAVPPTFRLR